jgi:hypothetical protein
VSVLKLGTRMGEDAAATARYRPPFPATTRI